MDGATDRWIEVALVGRPHGVRGEIYVRPRNPETALLTPGRSFRAAATPGEEEGERTIVVENVRRTGQGWLVKFEGVDQREVAAALTNRKLYVRRQELPALAPDEFYQADLIGLSIEDQSGRRIGAIEGFFDNGAHDVCVVRTEEDREVLVPFLSEALIACEPEAGVVRLEIPEGLPGLEAWEAAEEDEA